MKAKFQNNWSKLKFFFENTEDIYQINLTVQRVTSFFKQYVIYSHIIIFFPARLKEAGVEFSVVAIGATPSCSKPPDDIQEINEFHPGNYVFYGRSDEHLLYLTFLNTICWMQFIHNYHLQSTCACLLQLSDE